MTCTVKKKWIIGVAIVLLAISIVTVVLLFKPNNPPSIDAGSESSESEDSESNSPESVSIVEDCWKHVTEISVVEQNDGAVEVTLMAPDYVSLVKLLAVENNDTVTGDLISKAIRNNPETVKQYTFTASSSAESDVKKALMEQISYELLAQTLMDING